MTSSVINQQDTKQLPGTAAGGLTDLEARSTEPTVTVCACVLFTWQLAAWGWLVFWLGGRAVSPFSLSV